MNSKRNAGQILSTLTLAVAFCLPHVRAEPGPPVYKLDEFVVVGTRTPLSPERTSPSVSAISGEAMDAWQDRGLMDALFREPGVGLAQNGALGSVGSLFIRGTEARHSAVLLDGRRLNPGLSNQFALEHLAVDNLASVQLKKGASSVNYGSSGIGGVIDLRTRSGFDRDGSGHIEGEVGSNNYRRGAAGLAYSEDAWAVSFEASALSTDNERDNDAYERASITQRLDYKLTDALSLELVGRYTDTDKEAPGRISNPSSFAFGESENWLLSPGVRYATDEISVHLFYSRSEFDRQGVDDFGAPFPFESSVESDELSLQVDFSLAGDALLTAGANYRSDKPQSSNNPGFDTNFEQTGAFLQLIAPLTESFELRAGVRGDDFSQYEDSLTGSIEAIYFNEALQLSVFTKLANSYSPPTGQDLIFDGDPGTPVKPEESVSYEVGLRKDFLQKDLEVEMVYFRNEIEDLIVFTFDPVTFISDGFNEEEALTEGVETRFSYQVNENFSLSGSYTYLTAENESDDERLVKRPRHTIQAAAELMATEEIRFGLNALSYIDRLGFGGADLDDFVLVNLVADWRVTDDWTVFARADNLFDKDYELSAGFPSLGRTGYLGVRLEF